MLVWDGGQSGTIGGGALEYQAVNALRARLAAPGTTVDKLPLGPALGQCCGGAVTLVSEVFGAADLAQIDPSDAVHARRVSGDADMPLSVTRLVAQARSGQPGPLTFQNGWLAEPVRSQPTPLWVYGAGHVGRAIVGAMAPLPEFAITWVDTELNRFPDHIPASVTALPATNPAATVAMAPSHAQHLILTYAHTLDLELCHQLLSHGFAGAGLIGSKTKWARFQTRLRSLGHADAQIGRITCPIGDPGLGKHPQAIALGVAAALVMQSRSRARDGRKGTQATGGHAKA